MLKAPFPYFGGKSTIAPEVWTRFGNVKNEAVRQWLDEQAGNLPKLPKSAITDLRQEYLTVLRRELTASVQRRAIEDAQELLSDVVSDIGDAMKK